MRILAAVFDLGVESFDLVFVPGALCGGDLLFESSVPSGSAAQAIGGDGCFLESEIDADGLSVRAWLRLDVYVDTEVPVSAGVFGKASGAEGVGPQSVGVPDVEAVAGEVDMSVFPCCGAAFEGAPSRGSSFVGCGLSFATGVGFCRKLFVWWRSADRLPGWCCRRQVERRGCFRWSACSGRSQSSVGGTFASGLGWPGCSSSRRC